jgi:hypothetical protein
MSLFYGAARRKVYRSALKNVNTFFNANTRQSILSQCRTCTSQCGSMKFYLLRPFLWKARNMNVEGGWKKKSCFVLWRQLITVALRQMTFGTMKDHVHTSFTWIFNWFDESFKCHNGAKCWGYVGTNSEPLCAEVCNFLQCIFLTYFP